jgi:hypothetical protein
VNILPYLGLCTVVIQQNNLLITVTLKWSKDRFFHRLQFTGSLTWKAGQCSMGPFAAPLWYPRVMSPPQNTKKAGTFNFITTDRGGNASVQHQQRWLRAVCCHSSHYNVKILVLPVYLYDVSSCICSSSKTNNEGSFLHKSVKLDRLIITRALRVITPCHSCITLTRHVCERILNLTKIIYNIRCYRNIKYDKWSCRWCTRNLKTCVYTSL